MQRDAEIQSNRAQRRRNQVIMSTTLLIKSKVLQEIDLIPEDRLTDVYHFIHDFRMGLENSRIANTSSILSFAGCWKDMPNDMFTEFSDEIELRRQQAFHRRRKDEGSSD